MLTRIAAPAAAPVTLAEAKAHLRVTDDFEDDLITGMIDAATDTLDGPNGFLGRAIVTQTWQYQAASLPSFLRLPLDPVQSIAAFTYLDADGDEQAFTGYRLTGDILDPLTSWPSTATRRDAITIEFVVGYGDPADVPEAIKKEIYRLVAHEYFNRGDEKAGRSDVFDFGSFHPHRTIRF